jgi:uncharacterized membrane protein
MPDQDELRSLRERMDALTEANVRLLRRVADLEARLARLDGGLPAAVPPLEDAKPAGAGASQPELLEPAPVRAEPFEPATRVEPARPLETRLGLAWVNRAAVLTCVLAAAFFFKYATDNEWIGPEVRVAIGAALGLAAGAFSLHFFRRGELVVAQGLAGIGSSLLYLAGYAAFAFYHLLAHAPAFAWLLIVTAGGSGLALRYNSQAVAVLAALGGYATPVLLSTGERRTIFLTLYIVALSVWATGLARRRGWPYCERVALASAVVLSMGLMPQPQPRILTGLAMIALYALFATSPQGAAVYVAQFAFPTLAIGIWQERPWEAFSALAVFVLGGFVVTRLRGLAALPLISLTSAAAQVALFTSVNPGMILGISIGAGILFLMFFGWIQWKAVMRRGGATQPDLVSAAFGAIAYFGLLYYLIEGSRPGSDSLLGWIAIALGGLHGAAGRWLEPRDGRASQLYFGIAAGFVIIAVPLEFSEFGIAMAWALEGAALAWISARTESRAAAVASQLVLLLSLPFLDNAPLLAWLTAAVCWLMASQWFPERRWRAAAYVAGHLLLLAGISIELSQWAVRQTSEQDARAVSSTVLTVTAALYAVVLVALGVVTRTSINRLVGLALIGLVFAKLYLRDVWDLRMLYRVIAFAALGGLLLSISMLYSRFRERIERWWADSREDRT